MPIPVLPPPPSGYPNGPVLEAWRCEVGHLSFRTTDPDRWQRCTRKIILGQPCMAEFVTLLWVER